MAELIGRSNGSMSMGTTNSTGGVTTTTTSASTSSSGAGATASASENASSASAAASASSTMTMTETRTTTEEVLRLTLQDRPGVTWDQDVIDNEGMGRKSSKRCCIFHKPRPFGESSTDTSDYDSDNNDSSNNNNRKIAHKKNPGTKKTPDHLRFHA